MPPTAEQLESSIKQNCEIIYFQNYNYWSPQFPNTCRMILKEVVQHVKHSSVPTFMKLVAGIMFKKRNKLFFEQVQKWGKTKNCFFSAQIIGLAVSVRECEGVCSSHMCPSVLSSEHWRANGTDPCQIPDPITSVQPSGFNLSAH